MHEPVPATLTNLSFPPGPLSLPQDVSVEDARKYLGRFGLSGDLALQTIESLSGGQKSRLAFAELAWRKPHILLLDEPTNHLDLETIEAMAMALNKFDGGVVLVSHDQYFVSRVANEVWVVEGGQVKRAASFDAFRKQQLTKLQPVD